MSAVKPFAIVRTSSDTFCRTLSLNGALSISYVIRKFRLREMSVMAFAISGLKMAQCA